MATVRSEEVIPPAHRAALENFVGTGDWFVLVADTETATYELVTDIGEALVTCSVQLDTEPLFDLNNEREIASQGKRFGDGQIVASIPHHLLYAPEAGNIGHAVREKDWAHVNRKLNDADFRKFRTFRGRL